ncbi:hypothetical protein [Microcystis phage MinS1]|nr:hypothetical protein [Microcystis phage MinS1]
MHSEFVDVYAKSTGKKHRVPAHYLDDPVLMKPFRKTPKLRAAETRALGSATPVADVINPTPDSTTPTTETPAAGD